MKYTRGEAKEFTAENLRGIWAANLTPFSEDLSVDEAGFRANLRHWIDDLGIAGLFVCGKQAEFFSMSLDERKRQFEIVMEEVGDRAGTMLSCSDENIDTVLDLAKLAPEARRLFEALPQGPATLSPEALGRTLLEPHPSWMTRIEVEWLRRYSR